MLCEAWLGHIKKIMKKAHKTNAARILDRVRIVYQLVAYEVDEQDLSALHLARQLQEDAGRIFKTLVLQGERSGFFVCILPGDQELDLKKAAKVSGNKSCAMLPMNSLLQTTGYIRGGCSPLGMKKLFPTYIDASVLRYESVYVSAGQRGLQLLLAPKDLIAAVGGTVAELTL